MTRKPPPEGARWTIPDWSPDSSAHEQEVVQYLDQLEMLRRELAQEKESGEAKQLEIDKLKKSLSSIKTSETLQSDLNAEKVKSMGWAKETFRLVDKLKQLEKDNAELALKIPKPKEPTKLNLFEKALIYGAISAVGLSVIHSVFTLGSWGWKAVTAPSEASDTVALSPEAASEVEQQEHRAALQCVLKQRALAEGRPTAPLGPEDRPLPPPAALKPVPSNFLSVGPAANTASWRGVTINGAEIALKQKGSNDDPYSLHITGNIVNLSQNTVNQILGEWYVIGLRGASLECEPLRHGYIFYNGNLTYPGSSNSFEYTAPNAIKPPPGEDIVVKVFASFYPTFLGDSR